MAVHIELPPCWRPEIQQVIFRQLLQATSYPGSTQNLARWIGDDSPATAIVATLLDRGMPLADPHRLIPASRSELLGMVSADIDRANFVLADASREPDPDFQPCCGDLYRPERGASLILVCEQLVGGDGRLDLRGPGIHDSLQIPAPAMRHGWLERRNDWNRWFPLGVDIWVTDAQHVMAWPRTTRIEVIEAGTGS